MSQKISKQELTEPDKFQVILSHVMTYLSENKKKIYIISTACAAILVLGGVWYLYELNMEKSAQQIYARSYTTVAADRTIAAGIFKEVLDKYPRSRAAMFAHYRLGALYYQQNDFDASIRHYEAFIQKIPDTSDLKTIALMGLGYCYEGKKDYKNALSYFEKAASSKAGEALTSVNSQHTARVYEAMNDRAKALEYYQKALSKNVDPLIELQLRRKIASLS